MLSSQSIGFLSLNVAVGVITSHPTEVFFRMAKLDISEEVSGGALVYVAYFR